MSTESQQQIAPKKDKREVILEFHSSPDAILNALHQAGWRIIPRLAQPQRSEQPQFNLETLEGRKAAWSWLEEKFGNPLVVTKDGVPFEDQGEGIRQFKAAAQRTEQQEHDAKHEGEAIKRLSDALTGGNASTWDEIFHAAENVAEVRKPLVDALKWLKKWLNRQGQFDLAIKEIDDALEKVKLS